MSTAVTTPAASSPAPVIHTTLEAPVRGEARAEWLKTGNLPEPPKEESAPSKETPAAGEQPAENSAPASETGKEKQEQRQSKADVRLNEILDDLREAGLTPKALKSFKDEWQRKQQQAEPAQAAPEKTENPADSKLKPPVKPKPEDFEGKPWSEYEAAKDKYAEDLAEYKAAKAIEDFQVRQQQEAQGRELQSKLAEAKTRYGDEAESTIRTTADSVFRDAKVPDSVKRRINKSPILVDLLYVLGEKPGNLQDFLQTAHSDEDAAITKLVLLEHLTKEELAGKGEKAPEGQAPRGEDGKFAKAPTPEKKTTDAPPPPREVAGRGPAPDEVEAAFQTANKSGDARSFIEAETRRQMRRRKGL